MKLSLEVPLPPPAAPTRARHKSKTPSLFVAALGLLLSAGRQTRAEVLASASLTEPPAPDRAQEPGICPSASPRPDATQRRPHAQALCDLTQNEPPDTDDNTDDTEKPPDLDAPEQEQKDALTEGLLDEPGAAGVPQSSPGVASQVLSQGPGPWLIAGGAAIGLPTVGLYVFRGKGTKRAQVTPEPQEESTNETPTNTSTGENAPPSPAETPPPTPVETPSPTTPDQTTETNPSPNPNPSPAPSSPEPSVPPSPEPTDQTTNDPTPEDVIATHVLRKCDPNEESGQFDTEPGTVLEGNADDFFFTELTGGDTLPSQGTYTNPLYKRGGPQAETATFTQNFPDWLLFLPTLSQGESFRLAELLIIIGEPTETDNSDVGTHLLQLEETSTNQTFTLTLTILERNEKPQFQDDNWVDPDNSSRMIVKLTQGGLSRSIALTEFFQDPDAGQTLTYDAYLPEDLEKTQPPFVGIDPEAGVLTLDPRGLAAHPEAQTQPGGGHALELFLVAQDDGTPVRCTARKIILETEAQTQTESSPSLQSLPTRPEEPELGGSAEPHSVLFHVTDEAILLL